MISFVKSVCLIEVCRINNYKLDTTIHNTRRDTIHFVYNFGRSRERQWGWY